MYTRIHLYILVCICIYIYTYIHLVAKFSASGPGARSSCTLLRAVLYRTRTFLYLKI